MGVPQPLDRDVHGFAIYVDPSSCPWSQEQPGTGKERLVKAAKPSRLLKSSQPLGREGSTRRGPPGMKVVPFRETLEFEQVVKQYFLEARKQPCQYWARDYLASLFPHLGQRAESGWGGPGHGGEEPSLQFNTPASLVTRIQVQTPPHRCFPASAPLCSVEICSEMNLKRYVGRQPTAPAPRGLLTWASLPTPVTTPTRPHSPSPSAPTGTSGMLQTFPSQLLIRLFLPHS